MHIHRGNVLYQRVHDAFGWTQEPVLKLKARTSSERGEKGPLCDPRSELLLGGSARTMRA